MVVDGNGEGGQQTLFLIASEQLVLEVGLRPDGLILFQLLIKPFIVE